MLTTRAMTTYRRIAEALRDEILSGILAAGERLPPERDLCQRFGASRITVREALKILEGERLIRRQQGSGTYVSPRPTRKIPILTTDFFGSINRHAPDLTRRLICQEWRCAEPEAAAVLGLLSSERFLYARRIDFLGGTPVAADEVYLRACFADRLTPADLAELDFLTRWQQTQQIVIAYVTEAIEAVPAEPPMTDLLQVEARSPLLKETDIVFLTGDRPAGVFASFYRHDYFRLTTTVRLPVDGRGEE